jgi:hypothetical protein
MALFDFLKKKPRPAGAPPPPGMPPPPVDTVQQMQGQGFSNNQIMQSMQKEGHDLPAINDAFAQSGAQQELGPPSYQELPRQFQTPRSAGISREQVEEIAESIIEEKSRDLHQQQARIDEWKADVNTRVDKIDQSITDMKADLANLHKAIVSKIGEYDKNLLAVGTEIKAMEKVFQKILPTLTENVSELSRITKKVKPAKK